MQAKAIFYAISKVMEKGIDVKPEIMIPLVGHVNELREMRQLSSEKQMTSLKIIIKRQDQLKKQANYSQKL